MTATADQFTNITTTYVNGGAGGVGTTLGVGDTTLYLPTGLGARYPSISGSQTFRVLIGTTESPSSGEIVTCTARATDTLTIVRAQEGTSAQAWPVGTAVQQVATAGNFANLWGAINRGRVYNVLDYGAVGNGSTDDRAAIQAALDACRVAGGGTVYLPAATYAITTCPAHPTDNTINCSLVIGAQTTMRGDGPGATLVKWTVNTIPNQGHILNNYNRLSPGGDTDMAIVDMTFCGNAGIMPGTVDAQYGPQWNWARRVLMRNVVAYDFLGTGDSGNGPNGTPAENWHLDAHYCTDVLFDGCAVFDSGVNVTGSGFSLNYCSYSKVIGCTGYGMHLSRNFTHFHCRNTTYVGCMAYASGDDGFNSEISVDTQYIGCVSGGESTDTTNYPYTTNTNLGNAKNGFRIYNSSSRVQMLGCVSEFNTLAGVAIVSSSGNGLRIIGGSYASNGTYGINQDASGGGFTIGGSPSIVNNTTNSILLNGATASATTNAITSPAVPATTVAFTNPYPFACAVVISGGTVSQITVCGITVASATGVTVIVPPNQNIKLTYTVAPSWSWYSLL